MITPNNNQHLTKSHNTKTNNHETKQDDKCDQHNTFNPNKHDFVLLPRKLKSQTNNSQTNDNERNHDCIHKCK